MPSSGMFLSWAFRPCALGSLGEGLWRQAGWVWDPERFRAPHRLPANPQSGQGSNPGCSSSPARPPGSPWPPWTQGAWSRRPPCSLTAAEAPRWGAGPCILALGAGARATGGLPGGSALGRPRAKSAGKLGAWGGGGRPVRGCVGSTAGRISRALGAAPGQEESSRCTGR